MKKYSLEVRVITWYAVICRFRWVKVVEIYQQYNRLKSGPGFARAHRPLPIEFLCLQGPGHVLSAHHTRATLSLLRGRGAGLWSRTHFSHRTAIPPAAQACSSLSRDFDTPESSPAGPQNRILHPTRPAELDEQALLTVASDRRPKKCYYTCHYGLLPVCLDDFVVIAGLLLPPAFR